MSTFCPNCGSPIENNVKFCPNCGKPAPAPAAPAAGNGAVREGVPAPGFSDRVNHPEILAAIKKSRGAAKIFLLILIPVPVIGFILYSLITGKMEIGQAALTGGIVSAVILLFALISFVRERAANSYEAVVTKQVHHERIAHHGNGNGESVDEYITCVQTSDGKRKKIREYGNGQIWAFHYLQEGDRFRYHPQFHFPYEKYDKAHADGLYCVSCGTKNPVEADRCKKCNLPLLK